MKSRAVVALLALTSATSVQAIDPVVSAIMPHPVSIAIITGRWLLEDTKKTYYIQVASEGQDFDEAKKEAFNLAVNQAVGSLLVSETQVRDGELARRDITNYSSGYVERFEIKSKTDNDGRVQLVVDVWVSGNNIQNRLLAESRTAGRIEGAQARATIDSYMANRTSGDDALTFVLKDYPSRAFQVTAKPTQIQVDSQRKTSLVIPLEITWDYKYILALTQALEATADTRGSLANSATAVKVIAKDPKAWIAGWRSNIGFNDTQKYNLLYQHMIASGPAVKVTIKNTSGQPVYIDCYEWADFKGQYRGEDTVLDHTRGQFLSFDWNNRATVYGNHQLVGHVTIPVDSASVRDLDRVDMAVVRSSECHV